MDDRGSLRYINDFDMNALGIKRFYQIENNAACDTRCWHGHEREAKYIYCVRGSATVIAIKMGKDPVTAAPSIAMEHGSGKVEKTVMSAAQPRALYIPAGYVNGFRTLEPGTILMVFSTSSLEESKGDDYRFSMEQLGYNPFEVEIR